MLAQSMTVFFAVVALILSSVSLNVNGAALMLSQTQGIHSTYSKRNASTATTTPMNGKPVAGSGSLAQRDIPAPVMNMIKAVEKFVKRGAAGDDNANMLATRDIPAPIMNAIKAVEKFVKRGEGSHHLEMVERDIPAPVMNMIKSVEKFVKRAPAAADHHDSDQLATRDIPPPVMNLIKSVEKFV
ncbi:hypothetical protein PCASD_09083 [Puccinia coronata f. sp. avenae]|uniref:Uncharacterized protein n=1 Tax=Puccinia coronata f. sp. avenae TaxID=200324 RepID=A0A2N5TDJ6_9BASI|nr:hypothetical protein PCASD_09083 [Puccinia coronata f. sp. avenae]